MIGVNRRRVMGGGGTPLPYDAEIEYLESSGTQIINTGMYGSEALKTELSVQELRRDAGFAVFGSFSSGKNYYLYQGGGNVWQVGFRDFNNTRLATDTDRHTFLFDNFNVYKDGVLMFESQQGNFMTSNELWLFNMTGGNYRSVSKRVYYCKMWNNGVLTRDFIPVRVGQTGFLYDRVNGQLYGNVGTGDFILGADKN